MSAYSSTVNRLTRREMLAGFLGLPVALAACRNASVPPAVPDGEMVGASDVFGHRLRERMSIEIPSDNWQYTSVVIVGGGVAGLAAARKFLQAGFEDFVLLELESAPGGTSRSGQSPVIAYPWGAHYLPVPMKENVALVSLLDEMEVTEGRDEQGEPIIAEQFLCRDPEERVFYKDRWYEGLYLHAGASAEDQRQLETFLSEVNYWVAWRDRRGRRAFTIPIADCSDDAEATALDRVSMSDWLTQRNLTSSRLRWLVDYSCRDDYGLTVEQTSAWAGLFYFASRMSAPGVETQSLITWPEGNGRLVAHLYSRVQSKVRLGLAVADINPVERSNGQGVDVIAVDASGRNAFGFRADRVVFAAPQFLARHVIRPFREQPPAHLSEFQYGAWMVANLHLRDRPQDRGFPLAWDNVLYESPSLGYVAATHQRGLDRGATVFTYYYPLTDDDPRRARTRLLEMDRREWADVAMTDLVRAHRDIYSLTERLDVMRWGHAMISPRTNFIWSGARRAAAQPFRGIHFAHSDLSGIALFEEAFYNGTRAAEEVVTARES
jgi:phytoene dehydrogenase-like protein